MTKVGMLHSQRLKEPGHREIRERLSAKPADDLRQQHVIGVAVGVISTRRKIQLLLAREDVEDIVVGEKIRTIEPPSVEVEKLLVVAQSASVRQHLAQRDRYTEIGQLR